MPYRYWEYSTGDPEQAEYAREALDTRLVEQLDLETGEWLERDLGPWIQTDGSWHQTTFARVETAAQSALAAAG